MTANEDELERAAFAYEAKYPRKEHPARRHGFVEGARWAAGRNDSVLPRLDELEWLCVCQDTESEHITRDAGVSRRIGDYDPVPVTLCTACWLRGDATMVHDFMFAGKRRDVGAVGEEGADA